MTNTYTEAERVEARKALRHALFQYMDTVEVWDDISERRTLEQFEFHVDRIMMTLERDIQATVGEAQVSRIVQKLREGAL